MPSDSLTRNIGEIVGEISKKFPPLKLQHFFTQNISKNRHMKYNIYIVFHALR